MNKLNAILFALGISALSVSQSFAGPHPGTLKAERDAPAVSVAYADRVFQLGQFSENYFIKAVLYTIPGIGGQNLKVAALAGEFDEVVWEIPVRFKKVTSIQRKGMAILIRGEELNLEDFSSKKIEIVLTMKEMPEEPDTVPMIDSVAEVIYKTYL